MMTAGGPLTGTSVTSQPSRKSSPRRNSLVAARARAVSRSGDLTTHPQQLSTIWPRCPDRGAVIGCAAVLAQEKHGGGTGVTWRHSPPPDRDTSRQIVLSRPHRHRIQDPIGGPRACHTLRRGNRLNQAGIVILDVADEARSA